MPRTDAHHLAGSSGAMMRSQTKSPGHTASNTRAERASHGRGKRARGGDSVKLSGGVRVTLSVP